MEAMRRLIDNANEENQIKEIKYNLERYWITKKFHDFDEFNQLASEYIRQKIQTRHPNFKLTKNDCCGNWNQAYKKETFVYEFCKLNGCFLDHDGQWFECVDVTDIKDKTNMNIFHIGIDGRTFTDRFVEPVIYDVDEFNAFIESEISPKLGFKCYFDKVRS